MTRITRTKQIRRICNLCLLLALAGLAGAAQAKVRPEIMGVALEMSREAAQARLKAIGQLEKEDRRRQEVWAIKDPRISHLLVGYDAEYRVRYVTAIARPDGPRMRYQEVADLKSAQRLNNQGNYRFTWEIPERRGQFAFVVIALGRDPNFLDSYSIKKVGEKEVD
jgi:hypothetical protein